MSLASKASAYWARPISSSQFLTALMLRVPRGAHLLLLGLACRTGHDPGGFRLWWRALTGSDETLENAYLMRLAGRFSRRVRGYARAHGIPVIDCPAGQRKHDLAEQYLAKTN